MINPIAEKELVEYRRTKCNSCPKLQYAWGLKLPFIQGLKTCGVCKCSISAKTKLTYAQCPIDKW